jgi:hypothetical protein
VVVATVVAGEGSYIVADEMVGALAAAAVVADCAYCQDSREAADEGVAYRDDGDDCDYYCCYNDEIADCWVDDLT